MNRSLFLIFTLTILSLNAWSQQNMVTLSGGYTFANPEGSDETATGFRINGLYEFNPREGKIAHGANLGYLLNSYSEMTLLGTTDVKIRSWAAYYAPKLLLGNSEKFKFFLKGALGMHFSKFSTEGPALEVETYDAGFYGGAGAGGLLFLKPNVFLNLEYEWAYMSNGFYEDGFMNTIQLGVGYKF